MSVVEVSRSPVQNESVHSRGFCSNGSQGSVLEDKSILIYLNVAGSVIPMRVSELDSIASVKLRIQTCKGFVVKKQKLVFGGKELARGNSLVKDYGVNNGNVLHLVLKLSDLLRITARTTCGKEIEFHVDRFRNVGFLKRRMFKEGKGFVDVEEEPEIFFNGEKLDDRKVIGDICEYGDASIHLLVQKSATVRVKPVEKDFEISIEAVKSSNERREGAGDGKEMPHEAEAGEFWLHPVISNPKVKFNSVIWSMVWSTFAGLKRGNAPIQSSEGTGGAYLMQDASGQGFVSVFKPMDEEPMAVNNPRGLPVSSNGEGLKRGTKVGEGALREVAAYVLDHPKNGLRRVTHEVAGFAGVPPTIIIQCLHEGFNHPGGYERSLENVKSGSLQLFIKNEGNCDDMGPGTFPVEEVHKISVLDIRMANTDRHAGNILFSKGDDGQIMLIPIDHGYCLPDKFEDCTFDWLYWPQAHQPYSAEIIEYVNSLDAEQDILLLRFYGWDIPAECARVLRISTMLLKKGVERGLTPFAIGSIMCRETLDKESVIEKIVREAQDSLLPDMSNEAAFLDTTSQIMDSYLDKLTT